MYDYYYLHSLTAGIIESDDIKAITDEIDHAISFSNSASSLVESIKGKHNKKSKQAADKKVAHILPLLCVQGTHRLMLPKSSRQHTDSMTYM